MAKKEEKKKNNISKKGSYSAQDITVLEGLEPVRRRPGMYIGTTGIDGLHHLIWEIFDNSRDEAMGGFSNRIEVALLSGNRIRVVDNGRGIPVDIHPQTKVSALETIMTTLHAGGKFGGEGYKVSGGLHGVGASVVNALSIDMKAEVHREGGHYVQEYKQGKKKYNVKKIGTSKINGTVITFEPDKEIFKEIAFDWQKVIDHLRQQAYLVRGLKINVIDAREEKEIDTSKVFFLADLHLNVPSYTFCFEGGLMSLVNFYNKLLKPIHKNIFYVEKHMNEYETVEIALQYVDDIPSRILPFANNIYNSEGGMHVTGFKTALTRTINNYARGNNLIKEKDESFTGEDVLEGLTAVISIKLREIQFEGQTKAKLGSVEARGMVESVFSEGFSAFVEEHPEDARAIVSKVFLALRARKAAKAAKDSVLRKGALEGMTLPGKLADCQSKSAEESELFIVEGDSAGGTAKSGRDRHSQAILPLRGKILNIERARLDKALASEQIKNLVVALGTSISDSFDIKNLRYHKVIIATDADVDGAHIRTLLLTLFYRFLRELVD
ncbi:MAG: DNA gyrase subunit B, partial [Patescibacteria group bacterium]